MPEVAFANAQPEFLDAVDGYEPGDVFLTHLRGLLPVHWSTVRSGIWLVALSGSGHPAQGFKIHISTTSAFALSALQAVVPVCAQHDTDFKVAGDGTLLNLINSKRYAREGAGKFMTIYPRSLESFKDLIEAIYQRTREEPLVGPYILSDRRYKDSKIIYYRYGGFSHTRRVNLDGSHDLLIRAPDGTLVPDERRPYFSLPDWVEDPFAGEQTLADDPEPILRNRYRIHSVLVFSNAGGVYTAVDTHTDAQVIVKEARPHTHGWNGRTRSIDACRLLEHEWEVLRQLAHLDVVPAALDHFTEWEHSFLVEERLAAPSFWQFWAESDNLLAPYITRPGRIEEFVPKFQKLAGALIEGVQSVHDAGVVLGDLSPKNVLVHPDLRISFIDFESAVMLGDEELGTLALHWHTPGFGKPGRTAQEAVTFADDWYAAGMLLYSAIVPVQGLFLLDTGARDRFISEFVRMGIPVEARWIITALLEGNQSEAGDILRAWRATHDGAN